MHAYNSPPTSLEAARIPLSSSDIPLLHRDTKVYLIPHTYSRRRSLWQRIKSTNFFPSHLEIENRSELVDGVAYLIPEHYAIWETTFNLRSRLDGQN